MDRFQAVLVFGVLGYLFRKLKYPLAPLGLALVLVLGGMAESSFRQAMLLSQGSLAIFRSNPLVGSITTLAIAMRVWPALGSLKKALRRREMERDGRAR
jgi:putative tricarboxylic transport membrane protein